MPQIAFVTWFLARCTSVSLHSLTHFKWSLISRLNIMEPSGNALSGLVRIPPWPWSPKLISSYMLEHEASLLSCQASPYQLTVSEDFWVLLSFPRNRRGCVLSSRFSESIAAIAGNIANPRNPHQLARKDWQVPDSTWDDLNLCHDWKDQLALATQRPEKVYSPGSLASSRRTRLTHISSC